MQDMILDLQDAIDQLLEPWDGRQCPGGALSISVGSDIVLSRGFGMANLEHNIPNTADTVFRTGSVSKQFTAACIALLIQQGKLSLQDRFVDHFPEFDVDKTMTLGNLIYHTSGLKSYLALYGLLGYGSDYFDILSNDEVLETLQQVKGLNFNPGSQFLYSNTGYFLLGQLVKRVSGLTLREYAQHHIFTPLEMTSTLFVDDTSEIIPNRATGYRKVDDSFKIFETTCNIVGDGGVFSTVDDLSLWLQNFSTQQVGGSDFIDLITTRGQDMSASGKQGWYGFGLVISQDHGLQKFNHGGAFVGFLGDMMYFPEKELGIVICTNRADFPLTKFVNDLLDIIFPNQERSEGDLLQNHTGQAQSDDSVLVSGLFYSSDFCRMVEIWEDNGKYFAFEGYQQKELVASDGLFQYKDGSQRTLYQPSTGKVIMQMSGRDVVFDRVDPFEFNAGDYVGNYQTSLLNGRFDIGIEDSTLFTHHKLGGKMELVPVGQDTFVSRNLEFRFHRGTDGSITGLQVSNDRARDIRFDKLT